MRSEAPRRRRADIIMLDGAERAAPLQQRRDAQVRVQAGAVAAVRTRRAQRDDRADEQDGGMVGEVGARAPLLLLSRTTRTRAARRSRATRKPRKRASRRSSAGSITTPTAISAPNEFDFITYFECTDENLPVFDQICRALRDRAPEPRMEVRARGPGVAREAGARW